MTRDLRDARIFLVGFLAGSVLALLVPFVVRTVLDALPDREGPLDYVTVIDKNLPVGPRLDDVVARLDKATASAWRLRLLIRSTVPSQETTLTPKEVEGLRATLALPDPEESGLLAVATNVGDQASVAANGAFYLMSFAIPEQARDWLLRDAQIFVDDATDDRRKTYQAGALVFYYAPTGSVDHTSVMKSYVGEVMRCPTSSGPCPQ